MMNIVFRADGNADTGLGHIMRSAALMEMLMHDFDCRFFTKDIAFFPSRDFSDKAEVVPFQFEPDEEVEQLKKMIEPSSVVVLDGYQFNTAYQQQLKNAGFTVVCIDDIFKFHFVADVVINHAGGITPSDYSAELYTRFCLGPSFSLVRSVFSPVEKDLDRKVLLLSLGGADPTMQTEKILEDNSLKQFKKIHVVLGAANAQAEFLTRKYQNHSIIQVHHNISSLEMSLLMRNASYAVLPPSTVCYEYMATTGVVYLYQIADNQSQIKKHFLSEGLAFDFANLNEVTLVQMTNAISRQQEIFDGNSSSRLKEVFASLQQIIEA